MKKQTHVVSIPIPPLKHSKMNKGHDENNKPQGERVEEEQEAGVLVSSNALVLQAVS